LTSLFSGCTYTWKGDTEWKFLRNTSDWREEGKETSKKSRIKGDIKESKRKYKIENISLNENVLSIPVTRDSFGVYDESQREIVETFYLRNNMFYKKNPEKINKYVKGETSRGCLLGGLIGLFAGWITYDGQSGKSYTNEGALIGLSLGMFLGRDKAIEKCETDRTELTCDFEEQEEEKTESQEIKSKPKRQRLETLAENKTDREIPVRVFSDYFKFRNNEDISNETLAYTNENGIANASVLVKEGTFSKDVLKEKIKQEYNNNIKLEYKYFLEEIANSISPKRNIISISTEVKDNKLEIVNGSKNVSLEFYVLNQEGIDGAIKTFVDKNINSNIKEVKFSLRDMDSRRPITGARLELKSNSPKPEEVVSKYFTGKLAEKALKYITPYNIEEAGSYNDSMIKFQVYMPATYAIEIIHPDYNFISTDTVKFEEGKLDKVVDMIELGSKERKEDTEKKKGKISDKN